MDVGAFVESDPQSTKLIQPREHALDDATPPPHAAGMSRSADGQQWEDVADSKPLRRQ